MRKFTLPLFLLSLATIGVGCSSSSGGSAKAGGPAAGSATGTGSGTGTGNITGGASGGEQQAANGNTGSGGTVKSSNSATGGSGSGENGGTGTSGGTAAGGADPTDQAICAYLATVGDVTAHANGSLQYLCQKGGLAALRQAAGGQAQMISQTTDAQSNTDFMFGGGIKATGTLTQARKLGTIYCQSFSQYESIVGSAAFAQVQSITPSNATANGCDFNFKATPILFIAPQYNGHQTFFSSSDGTIAGSVNFLTNSVSVVVDATTLTVGAQYQGGLYNYVVLTSVSATDGFADTVSHDLLTGETAGLQGFAAAMAKGGF